MAADGTAGVLAPPPFIYGAALLVAWLLHRAAPLSWPLAGRGVLRFTGAALIVAGLLLSASVVGVLRRAKTSVSPRRPTRALLQSGPYRYSRNPDYVAQTLTYVGVAFVTGTSWPLVLLPVVIAVVHVGVVGREERYLASRFGATYRAYVARTPRWL